MAGRTKKKAAKKTAKKAKRPVKAARKAAAKKAVPAKKAVKKTKTSGNREFGEGNYKASKRFRTSQETFVKKNRGKIAGLGKAAEDALDGAEGADLRAAEAEAASHAAGKK